MKPPTKKPHPQKNHTSMARKCKLQKGAEIQTLSLFTVRQMGSPKLHHPAQPWGKQNNNKKHQTKTQMVLIYYWWLVRRLPAWLHCHGSCCKWFCERGHPRLQAPSLPSAYCGSPLESSHSRARGEELNRGGWREKMMWTKVMQLQ